MPQHSINRSDPGYADSFLNVIRQQFREQSMIPLICIGVRRPGLEPGPMVYHDNLATDEIISVLEKIVADLKAQAAHKDN